MENIVDSITKLNVDEYEKFSNAIFSIIEDKFNERKMYYISKDDEYDHAIFALSKIGAIKKFIELNDEVIDMLSDTTLNNYFMNKCSICNRYHDTIFDIKDTDNNTLLEHFLDVGFEIDRIKFTL